MLAPNPAPFWAHLLLTQAVGVIVTPHLSTEQGVEAMPVKQAKWQCQPPVTGQNPSLQCSWGWSHQFHPPVEVRRELKPGGGSRDLAASLPRSPVLSMEAPAVTCWGTKGSHPGPFSLEFLLFQHCCVALVCFDVSLLTSRCLQPGSASLSSCRSRTPEPRLPSKAGHTVRPKSCSLFSANWSQVFLLQGFTT